MVLVWFVFIFFSIFQLSDHIYTSENQFYEKTHKETDIYIMWIEVHGFHLFGYCIYFSIHPHEYYLLR